MLKLVCCKKKNKKKLVCCELLRSGDSWVSVAQQDMCWAEAASSGLLARCVDLSMGSGPLAPGSLGNGGEDTRERDFQSNSVSTGRQVVRDPLSI